MLHPGRPTRRTHTLVLLLAAALPACTPKTPEPRALLNESTGITINAVSQPLLFARLRPEPSTSARDAVNARDFVTLVALETDNAGKYTDLLLLYRFPVTPRGDSPGGSGELLIEADDHEIALRPLDRVPIDLSRSKELFLPSTYEYVAYAYTASIDTMRSIAASHELKVRLPQATPDTPFTLWKDGRPALAQLVRELTGT